MEEKATTIERSEYSSLGSRLKKQTDIAKKQYKGLYKVHEFDKKEDDETINKDDKKTHKKYNKSSLIIYSNQSFYKYLDIKIFDNLSLRSKVFLSTGRFNDLIS